MTKLHVVKRLSVTKPDELDALRQIVADLESGEATGFAMAVTCADGGVIVLDGGLVSAALIGTLEWAKKRLLDEIDAD